MDLLGGTLNRAVKAMYVTGFIIGGLDSFPASRAAIEGLFKPLGIIPLHLAFWLVVLSLGYVAITQGVKVRKLERTHPFISVASHVPVGWLCELDVYNRSPVEALFSATAQVSGGPWEMAPFSLPWMESADATARMLANGRQSLTVCKYEREDNAVKNAQVHYMVFNRMTSNGPVALRLAPYVEGQPPFAVNLMVSIAAAPSLQGRKEWYFTLRYRLPNGGIIIEPAHPPRRRGLLGGLLRRKQVAGAPGAATTPGPDCSAWFVAIHLPWDV